MTQVSSASEGAESSCECRVDGFCRFGAWAGRLHSRCESKVQRFMDVGLSYVIKLLGIVVQSSDICLEPGLEGLGAT